MPDVLHMFRGCLELFNTSHYEVFIDFIFRVNSNKIFGSQVQFFRFAGGKLYPFRLQNAW